MITTDAAIIAIKDMLKDETDKNLSLRIGVQGGGCSGFSYFFAFDHELNEDDFEFPVSDFKVIVDAMSMQYLTGATIDYKDDIMGSSFTINNPNAETSCGCGSSFSV